MQLQSDFQSVLPGYFFSSECFFAATIFCGFEWAFMHFIFITRWTNLCNLNSIKKNLCATHSWVAVMRCVCMLDEWVEQWAKVSWEDQRANKHKIRSSNGKEKRKSWTESPRKRETHREKASFRSVFKTYIADKHSILLLSCWAVQRNSETGKKTKQTTHKHRKKNVEQKMQKKIAEWKEALWSSRIEKKQQQQQHGIQRIQTIFFLVRFVVITQFVSCTFRQFKSKHSSSI